jgi:hypothetical protein
MKHAEMPDTIACTFFRLFGAEAEAHPEYGVIPDHM